METTYQRLLDASPDVFLVVEPGGEIVFANAAVRELLGYEPAELRGQQLEVLVPKAGRAGHASLRESYAGQPYVRDMQRPGAQTTGQRKDGSIIDLDVKLSPVEFQNQPCVLAVARDATEKAAFQAVTMAKHQALEARTRELEIEKKARERLFGVVAHDIRGPMSVLLGYTRLALEGRLGPLSEEIERAIRETNSVATHLLGIVDDLLDFSIVQDQAVTLKTQAVVLQDILKKATEMARFVAKPQEICVVFSDLTSAPARARLDPGKVLQAVNNLLSNAIKYSPRGSVVGLSLVAKIGEVIVSVTDQGPGIADSDKERIFDPYCTTESRPYQGTRTGLGLAIVKSYAEA